MSAADFYDALAPFYHLNYGDWPSGIERQAEALDTLLRSLGKPPPCSVLDAACGIGTQALGLAGRGYEVTASDLSAGAVARARQEAAARGLAIDFSVADMREVDRHHARTFEVVMACDNALPHLLDDDRILQALRAFHRCTAPGGVCLVTVRDYAAETRQGVQARPPIVHDVGEVRHIVFQVWEFEGSVYEMSLYRVEDRTGAEPRVQVLRASYYAVTTDVLLRLMREAGFQQVERIDGAFYQPVLLGRRPSLS